MGSLPYLHRARYQRQATVVVRLARPCVTRGSIRGAIYVCSVPSIFANTTAIESIMMCTIEAMGHCLSAPVLPGIQCIIQTKC